MEEEVVVEREEEEREEVVEVEEKEEEEEEEEGVKEDEEEEEKEEEKEEEEEVVEEEEEEEEEKEGKDSPVGRFNSKYTCSKSCLRHLETLFLDPLLIYCSVWGDAEKRKASPSPYTSPTLQTPAAGLMITDLNGEPMSGLLIVKDLDTMTMDCSDLRTIY